MAENEAAKRQLDENRVVRERSYAEYQERMKGKPTPTQEENDRAALGEHVTEKEDDGSGPDPGVHAQQQLKQQRQSEAQSSSKGGYQTRSVPPPAPPPKKE